MDLQPLVTDTKFMDSPDTGWPECICSHCSKMIKKHEMPLRMMPDNENAEYRYCEACQKKLFGIVYADNTDFDNSFYEPPY